MGAATALTVAVPWLGVKAEVLGALVAIDTIWLVAVTVGGTVTTGGFAKVPGLIGGETGCPGTTTVFW